MQPGISDLGRFRPYLQFLARLTWDRRLQPKLDPSDIVQQTLLKAHQGQSEFRGQTDPEVAAWLRQILANVLAEQQRYFHREKRQIGDEQSLASALAESSRRLVGWDASELGPDQRAEFSERALHVAGAIENLTADQRDAIVLHYWQGHTVPEIAELMQRTTAAVGGLVHRGLKTLRGDLAEFVEP